MQYGQFDDQAREYVLTRPDTPRPWSNYLGDTDYGAIITNHAGGYSFLTSGALGRFLRLRFNGVPLDQPGRTFYVRDRDTGEFWSPGWQPVGGRLDRYTCRHGTGYTIIAAERDGVAAESTYFVPLGQRCEYWRLRLTNHSDRPRPLSVFTYCEFASNWSTTQDLVNLQYSQFIVQTRWHEGLLRVAINDHLPPDREHFANNDQGRWSWLALRGAELTGWDTDRDAFLGPYGTYARPRAVVEGTCGGSLAYGDTACGGLQADVDLAPGETRELLVLLGVGQAEVEGVAAVAEFGTSERCEAELARVRDYWHSRLDNLHARTPDDAFDSMVNVWNPYNALIAFNWARSASLVYNGERDGLGFRDAVQDTLGASPLLPDEVEARLALLLTGQLSHGGALPLVRPFAHRPGAETPPPEESLRSDDCLWLFNALPAWLGETGRLDWLHRRLPYADRGEASVLGHLRRALEFNLERTGAHGLPCGLEADWNDCLRLGYHGESVFVACQLRYGLGVYADLARRLGDEEQAAWALARRAALDERIQASCWDGEWFVWAFGEDGTVYGSRASREGRLYLNTQVWAVISGAATPEQARCCLDAVHEQLATPYGLMLCTPPFAQTPVDVMRAVLFVPGVKENGGIFSHTQSWAVIAECLLGRPERAWEYWRAFMPATWNDQAELRQAEPYVHCQTVYSPHSARPGVARVPWLSGTASWAYYTATQWLLGVRPELDGLRVDPCLPPDWPAIGVTRRLRGLQLDLELRPGRAERLTVDGEPLAGNLVPYERLRDGSRVVVGD